MCLSETTLKINWIISQESLTAVNWIENYIFVLGSYEFLAMLGGKIRKGPFF